MPGDDWKLLEEHGNVVKHALQLAAAMENPKRPTCCAYCLRGFTLHLMQNSAALGAVRRFCHPFWRACMVLITTPRGDAELLSLNQQLLNNMDICPRMADLHVGRPDPDLSLANPLPLLVQLIYILLYKAMHGGARDMTFIAPKKGFGSKGVLWPVDHLDLIPLGAYESAVAHISWCCRLLPHQSPVIHYLGCALSVSRHTLFPHLLESPLRERLLWCLVNLLDGSGEGGGPGTALFPWTQAAQAQMECTTFQRPELSFAVPFMNLPSLVVFISTLHVGNDAARHDFLRFCHGCESALISACDHAVRSLSAKANLWATNVLVHFALELLSHTGPTSHRPADSLPFPDIINSGIDYYVRLYSALTVSYHRRHCFGPSCGRATNAEGFPRCGRCHFTQYCSKACQKEDWTRSAVPHKQICHILAAAVDSIQPDKRDPDRQSDPESFRTACLSVGLSSAESLRTISCWADSVNGVGMAPGL